VEGEYAGGGGEILTIVVNEVEANGATMGSSVWRCGIRVLRRRQGVRCMSRVAACADIRRFVKCQKIEPAMNRTTTATVREASIVKLLPAMLWMV